MQFFKVNLLHLMTTNKHTHTHAPTHACSRSRTHTHTGRQPVLYQLQVMIVGTHADHESLSKEVFEEIWEKLRELLVDAREHHTGYFRGVDRVCDCLLCQADCRCLRRSAGFVNLGYDDEASGSEDETSFR